MGAVTSAQVVVPCADAATLDATATLLTERLGFAIELVSPADDPSVVVVAGHGVRLRLERTDGATAAGPGPDLVVACDTSGDTSGDTTGDRSGDAACGALPAEIVAPNGSRIRFVPADAGLAVPELRSTLVVSRFDGDTAAFHTGRAGMGYRDLVPDRQGGRFIASHIRVADGGPVPDYVHYHRIRFQVIHVVEGWVEVVYEDQGEAFTLHAGDGVLQPPTIRHRVLACSPGAEVVELGCPAVHDTHADPLIALPTGRHLPSRRYGDAATPVQRFVRYSARGATWRPHPMDGLAGFELRDSGIAGATGGLAAVHVLRPATVRPPSNRSAGIAAHGGELWFGFVLRGSVRVQVDGLAGADGAAAWTTRLAAKDAVVVPPHSPFRLDDPSPDLELLEVALPAIPIASATSE